MIKINQGLHLELTASDDEESVEDTNDINT